MGTGTFLLYNNKMSWWRPWSILLPWYHTYRRRHMKSKSLNPGQMNTNLVYWHETGSFWYRPSWTILIWTPKNKSGCFCVDETLQVATIRTQHPFFLYKLKYRKSQSSVDDVNRCAHVFTSTRVLVCVPATGKHQKPIWLMHIWYQMEYNPHKYEGLNTLQYSLPPLWIQQTLGTRGKERHMFRKNSLVMLYALLRRLMLAHLRKWRICQSERGGCSLWHFEKLKTGISVRWVNESTCQDEKKKHSENSLFLAVSYCAPLRLSAMWLSSPQHFCKPICLIWWCFVSRSQHTTMWSRKLIFSILCLFIFLLYWFFFFRIYFADSDKQLRSSIWKLPCVLRATSPRMHKEGVSSVNGT